MSEQDTIWVVTAEPTTTRGRRGPTAIKVEELSVNVNLFLDQMKDVLEKTPEGLGRFRFVEFEIQAEVSAKGALALMGTGAEVSAAGGLKFVFRRLPEPSQSS